MIEPYTSKYLVRRYDWTLLAPTPNTFSEGTTEGLGDRKDPFVMYTMPMLDSLSFYIHLAMPGP